MQNHQRTSSCAHASCSSACNPQHTTTRRRLVSNISLATPKNQADHARDDRICKLYDLHDTLVPYETAWDWQRLLVDRCLEASSSLREANTATRGGRVTRGDSLLILQHPSVYTLGAGSTTANLLFDPASSTVPLFRVERGGEVTYHGPGQVGFFIHIA
jgi:lipoyl(octanoyl) transferase